MKHILDIKNFYSIRRKSRWKNDGFRSLYESIVPSEVLQTLDDWKNSYDGNYVLIGGVCLSFYLKPRYTEDIDLMFLTEEDIPKNVYKFRKNRPHSFEHIKTGVEVEMVTPELINGNTSLFKSVFDNSIISDGIRIASPESLIALKLGRFSDTDKMDIKNLYDYCIENNIEIDLSKYELSQKELKNFELIDKSDKISENHQMLEIKNYLKNKHFNCSIGDYEIYVFENKFGEPRFYFSKNLKSKSYNDFIFAISLTTFENNELRVVESSTGYKSLNSFKNEEELLKKWLPNNLSMLKESWNKLNPNRSIK